VRLSIAQKTKRSGCGAFLSGATTVSNRSCWIIAPGALQRASRAADHRAARSILALRRIATRDSHGGRHGQRKENALSYHQPLSCAPREPALWRSCYGLAALRASTPNQRPPSQSTPQDAMTFVNLK